MENAGKTNAVSKSELIRRYAPVVQWAWNGWDTAIADGYKLTYTVSMMIAAHPDMKTRCLIAIVGPLSIAIPWFEKREA